MFNPLPNLRHLQLFLDVVRLGAVSAAARTAHLSQPAVTQAIAHIESYMGGALLLRTPKGPRPTPAGRDAAIRIDRALALLREALPGARGKDAARLRSPDALHRITTTHLMALLQVAEHGSFAAAAARVERSRAGIQRAVRQLETALDISLVDLSSGRLLLTREGEKLAQRARLAATEIAQAHAEVAQSMGRAEGRTIIGAMPLARSAIVPGSVLAFAAERPHHSVTILDGPYETLLWALRNGQADVLIGALRDPAPTIEVLQEYLFDDPLSIIVRAGHPLASMRRLRADSLAPYDWIAPPADSPLRRHFDALYRTLPAYRRSAPIECSSLEVARALLNGSERIMLLSRQQVHRELKSGELAALPHPLGAVSRAIGLTLRRNWHPTAEQALLLQVIRQQARAAAGLRG